MLKNEPRTKLMKPRIVIAVVAIIAVLLTLAVFAQNSRKPGSASANMPTTAAKTASQAHQSKIIAYYFHGTVRCVTCRKIESLSHDVVVSDFAEPLKTGLLEWQVVNVDLPENQHFIRDYQLVAKSLVLVKYEDGKQVGYKNLQKIWTYINNEQSFRAYVKGELQVAMGRS
jgi:hypothetical protein